MGSLWVSSASRSRDRFGTREVWTSFYDQNGIRDGNCTIKFWSVPILFYTSLLTKFLEGPEPRGRRNKFPSFRKGTIDLRGFTRDVVKNVLMCPGPRSRREGTSTRKTDQYFIWLGRSSPTWVKGQDGVEERLWVRRKVTWSGDLFSREKDNLWLQTWTPSRRRPCTEVVVVVESGYVTWNGRDDYDKKRWIFVCLEEVSFLKLVIELQHEEWYR